MNRAAAHTPGPWVWAESTYEPNKFSIGTDSGWLASVQHNGEQLVERQRANVSLIAAAPDLLSALELLVAGIENSVSDTYIPLAKARAAIAKATA